KLVPLVRQPFQCKITDYCISDTLRCNGIVNCGFGDESDGAGCTKEANLNLLDLLGGLAGLSVFVIFTVGILCLTGIMLVSWYRRIGNETKENINGGANKPPGGIGSLSANAYPHYHLHHPAVASI